MVSLWMMKWLPLSAACIKGSCWCHRAVRGEWVGPRASSCLLGRLAPRIDRRLSHVVLKCSVVDLSGINSFEISRNCKTDTWHLLTLLPHSSVLFTVSCILGYAALFQLQMHTVRGQRTCTYRNHEWMRGHYQKPQKLETSALGSVRRW